MSMYDFSILITASIDHFQEFVQANCGKLRVERYHRTIGYGDHLVLSSLDGTKRYLLQLDPGVYSIICDDGCHSPKRHEVLRVPICDPVSIELVEQSLQRYNDQLP